MTPLSNDDRNDIGVEGTQDAQLWCHEADLIAVLKNLVDNAIRYTSHGGRVDLSVTTQAAQVILKIQDSGPGIAVVERERVFDSFYRTLGSDQAGSGLGLSIVRAILARMGTDIALDFVDTAQCSGLCVSVFIPLRNKQ